MVFVRELRLAVFAEALLLLVVVMVDPFALPIVVALDAEVVIAFLGQLALPGARFEDALGEGDAGGYAVFPHLLYGYL